MRLLMKHQCVLHAFPIFLVLLSACQYSSAANPFPPTEIGDYECANINSSRYDTIKSSTKCTKMWSDRNCKGSELEIGSESLLSISGCKTCSSAGGFAGYHCSQSDSCIPLAFICDNDVDCEGGEDEENCDDFRETCSYKGNQVMYKCEGSIDRRCVPFSYLCDNDKDCPEGDDERNCTTDLNVLRLNNQCQTGNFKTGFKCLKDGYNGCAFLDWMCNTEDDCDGGLDEKYCDRRCNFRGNEPGFMCKDSESRCISRSWACDGVRDCLNGEDERNCTLGEKGYSIAMNELIFAKYQEATTPLGDPVPEFIEELEMGSFEVYDQKLSSVAYPVSKYIAYNRVNPNESTRAGSVSFGRDEKIVMYLPGYATADLEDGLRVKDALFQGTDDVDWVVLVDWRQWSLPFYDNSVTYWLRNYSVVATKNVKTVAGFVKNFIVRKLTNENDVYLVGFGLGAQIAGIASREAAALDNFSVDRITALDPAGPIFEYSLFGMFPIDTTNTLRETDAAFVDVIHASSVLGLNNDVGHLDVFLTENECWRPSCRHHKALDLYISSLTRCSLLTCPRSGECSPETMSDFGYLADKYEGRGNHDLFVVTNIYSWSDNLCSNLKTAYFPAKDRICKDSPVDAANTTNCENKPYLSECPIFCRKQNVHSKSACSWNSKVTFDSEWDLNPPDSGTGTGSAEGATGSVEWQGGTGQCGFLTGCQNEEGHNVPYFVAYKPPNTSEYYVIYPEGDMAKSLFNQSSPQSVFGRTLQTILEPHHDDSTGYVVWHDDVRNMEEASGPGEFLHHSHGHSDGVLAFDRKGGFLMIQRFPDFPLGTEYHLSKSQDKYAQLSVCVSMYSNSKGELVTKLNTILDGLETFKPKVVMTGLGQGVDQSLKRKLANLGKKRDLSTFRKPEISDVTLTSEFNAHFFGRYRFGGKPSDAYVTLSRKYATSLKVQNGNNESGNRWPSSPCWSPFTVENVERVRVGEEVWNSTQDHSNWAVAGAAEVGGDATSSSLVCFGDLNRVPSSMARGGMFLCTRKQSLHDLFSQFPDAIETCS